MARLTSGTGCDLCYAIARNHPFVDGNKRASFLALVTFLGLNGIAFKAPEPEAAAAIIALAASEISEEALARWVRDRMG